MLILFTFYPHAAPIQRAPQIRPDVSMPSESEAPAKLPSALENVLSFKDLRAMQVKEWAVAKGKNISHCRKKTNKKQRPRKKPKYKK